MTLPPQAVDKLLQPLRNAESPPRSARDHHTVPVDESSWRWHADALADAIRDLSQSFVPPGSGFKEIQDWIAQLLRQRDRVVGLLFSLEPFAPYDPRQADGLLDLLEALPAGIIAAIDGNAMVGADVERGLADAADWWSARKSASDGECLSQAFGMRLPPIGAQGSFRPEWVLQHYAYRNSDLLIRLVPHLVSLGMRHVTDVLAAVYAVGQIVDCDDSIAAYIAASTLTNRYLAADPTVADQFRGHLRVAEPALRRVRSAVSRAREAALTQTEDAEARAVALADAYKRTIEGPFRQYSWAAHCLKAGVWSTPPMLTSLREQLVREGGSLGALVGNVVLPDMRNSETHETLVWDGFAEQFVTEKGNVDVLQVAAAFSLATSFVQGSEAGVAAMRALHLRAEPEILPSAEEDDRMPAWDRVRAFFGTNRISLLKARLNTPYAHFRVQRIEHRDVNPCFQALVMARRLLPRTEQFEVSAVDSDGPLIVVDTAALDATMPSWNFAVSHLDQMPLATFLPANLDARMRHETEGLALRSVAWIAVDDAVGVIDGSPECWDDDARRLLDTRLRVVEIAVASTRRLIGTRNTRLESVQQSMAELRSWIADGPALEAAMADDQLSMSRLRAQWEQWGPVVRHPLIPEVPFTGEFQAQPALRTTPDSMHFRTL
ncbi:hypothetical protein ACQXVK_16865 [Curtobacterium sp. AB451]|uniref:hypothetical protein n=1 Tax=Curtobacterium sp. AB451 TaxID=3422306 RepID=UPI003D3456D5